MLLPVVDRRRRLQRLDRVVEELAGVHGHASYRFAVATLVRVCHARTPTHPPPSPRPPSRRSPGRARAAGSASEVRLTADRLVVRVPENGERKSSSGLLIPATAMPAPKHLAWAEVHLVGPDVRVAKPGDRVLFLPSSGLEVELDGEELVLLRERDVQAVASARRESRSPARPVPLAPTSAGHAGTKLSRTVRVLFSRFGSTSTTDCHVPSATLAVEHRERSATETRTPAGDGRRRARPTRDDARTGRRAATAAPAARPGRPPIRSPSPSARRRPSRAGRTRAAVPSLPPRRRTHEPASVTSTTRRPDVSTSSSIERTSGRAGSPPARTLSRRCSGATAGSRPRLGVGGSAVGAGDRPSATAARRPDGSATGGSTTGGWRPVARRQERPVPRPEATSRHPDPRPPPCRTPIRCRTEEAARSPSDRRRRRRRSELCSSSP